MQYAQNPPLQIFYEGIGLKYQYTLPFSQNPTVLYRLLLFFPAIRCIMQNLTTKFVCKILLQKCSNPVLISER